jgi:hypothetical protein
MSRVTLREAQREDPLDVLRLLAAGRVASRQETVNDVDFELRL